MKEDNLSFQSEEHYEPTQPTKKQSQQFKALFLKNIRLQSKQIGTNLCQIFTPIICILFTFLMDTIASDNMPQGALYQPNPYPYKFNNYTTFDSQNQGLRDPLIWFVYDCQPPNCNETFLGINNGTQRNGLLGAIPSSYEEVVEFHPDPFNNIDLVQQLNVSFWKKNNQTSINRYLYDTLVQINDASIKVVQKGGLDILPDGTFDINNLNSTNIQFDVKINDGRNLEYHRLNTLSKIQQKKTFKGTSISKPVKDYTPPYGLLDVIDTLTSPFIQNVTNKTMQSGYVLMPDVEGTVSFVDTVINFVATLVFPIALSLLFPVFLYTVVLEKQQKLIQMMKMNGMKISSYWFVYFIFNLLLGLITNVVFFLFGYFLLGNRFFIQTNFFLLFVTLLGWLLAQIGLAVFFQTFLSSARSANIIGYLISIWTSMISSTLSIGVYQYPTPYPIGLRLFSPFGFTRAMYLMLTVCTEGKCYSQIDQIPEQMKQCIAFLYINFIFFFLLGTYLFEIIPQEFGVTRSIHFPFTMLCNFFKKCFSSAKQGRGMDAINRDSCLRDYIKKEEEDEYSKEERQKLLENEGNIDDYPLIVNNLRKLYRKEGHEGMYPAVRSFNLKVHKKQTFGLLGPNGAGKTTLISMITGMFQPNYGNAWVGGYSINKNLEKAQLEMGVCPQFDLLWPTLSVEEHLYFYARLKGIPSKQIERRVITSLQQVKLTKFKDFPSSSLSGGMKRRLSVAISLVGDPQIVFLDEPSTGLDPDNRRRLWQVLSKCQKRRAIFLTTHMMEEADTLCNRVGIITSGTLRTVASQNKLKNLYGGGYRMTISLTKQERVLVNRQSLVMMEKGNAIEDYAEDEQNENEHLKKSIDSFILVQEKEKKIRMDKKITNLRAFMKKWFPKSVLIKSFNGCLIFKLPLAYKVSEMLEIVQKLEKQLDIADISITNSSLEDVFMNVVSKFDQDFKNKAKDQGFNELQQENEEFYSFPNNEDEKVVRPQMKESSVISKQRQSVMSDEGQEMKRQSAGSEQEEKKDDEQ